MSKNNSKAWEQIKAEGLTVDVQVYPNDDGTSTAYVGTVNNSRDFSSTGFMGTRKFSHTSEAIRDSRAVARAISRDTGIPLHYSVPVERQKQVSSHTIGRAQLRCMYQMDQRQRDTEFEESLKGKLLFLGMALIVSFMCVVALYFAAWLMSLISQ